MKNWRLWLASFIGLSLAVVAAFYSVSGISKLFAGGGISVILLMGFLEAGKLVSTLLTHHYWDELNKALRTFFITTILTLMVVTSAGIYGFLSHSYQQTKTEFNTGNVKVELLKKQKSFYYTQISSDSAQIELKRERIISLTNLRKSQEIRLDTLYNRNYYTTARRTEKAIRKANDDIDSATVSMYRLNESIKINQDLIQSLELNILTASNNEATTELGPLLFISKITGWEMDKVVNILILMLIFVFDPLALILLITVQKLSHKQEVEIKAAAEVVTNKSAENLEAVKKKITARKKAKSTHHVPEVVDSNIYDEPVENPKPLSGDGAPTYTYNPKKSQ